MIRLYNKLSKISPLLDSNDLYLAHHAVKNGHGELLKYIIKQYSKKRG